MKLESIYEEWSKDSEIDMTDLGNEAIKIPKLHHKYFQVYSSEKLLLRKYEAEMKTMKPGQRHAPTLLRLSIKEIPINKPRAISRKIHHALMRRLSDFTAFNIATWSLD